MKKKNFIVSLLIANFVSAQDAIQIVDMEGRVIYTSDIQNQKFEIDISQFSSGVYVVRLNTSLGTATKKLTIAR